MTVSRLSPSPLSTNTPSSISGGVQSSGASSGFSGGAASTMAKPKAAASAAATVAGAALLDATPSTRKPDSEYRAAISAWRTAVSVADLSKPSLGSSFSSSSSSAVVVSAASPSPFSAGAGGVVVVSSTTTSPSRTSGARPSSFLTASPTAPNASAAASTHSSTFKTGTKYFAANASVAHGDAKGADRRGGVLGGALALLGGFELADFAAYLFRRGRRRVLAGFRGGGGFLRLASLRVRLENVRPEALASLARGQQQPRALFAFLEPLRVSQRVLVREMPRVEIRTKHLHVLLAFVDEPHRLLPHHWRGQLRLLVLGHVLRPRSRRERRDGSLREHGPQVELGRVAPHAERVAGADAPHDYVFRVVRNLNRRVIVPPSRGDPVRGELALDRDALPGLEPPARGRELERRRRVSNLPVRHLLPRRALHPPIARDDLLVHELKVHNLGVPDPHVAEIERLLGRRHVRDGHGRLQRHHRSRRALDVDGHLHLQLPLDDVLEVRVERQRNVGETVPRTAREFWHLPRRDGEPAGVELVLVPPEAHALLADVLHAHALVQHRSLGDVAEIPDVSRRDDGDARAVVPRLGRYTNRRRGDGDHRRVRSALRRERAGPRARARRARPRRERARARPSRRAGAETQARRPRRLGRRRRRLRGNLAAFDRRGALRVGVSAILLSAQKLRFQTQSVRLVRDLRVRGVVLPVVRDLALVDGTRGEAVAAIPDARRPVLAPSSRRRAVVQHPRVPRLSHHVRGEAAVRRQRDRPPVRRPPVFRLLRPVAARLSQHLVLDAAVASLVPVPAVRDVRAPGAPLVVRVRS
eukprot:31115-Pelagococcus_subviridis.AAC.9